MTTITSTMVAVFDNLHDAQRAIESLRRDGFREDQIGIAVRDGENHLPPVIHEQESLVEEGAVTGIIAGAGIGGLWAIGIAAGVLPVIGPVIAGGLLASILASAAGTAAVGGIFGALIGMGLSEEEAHYYGAEFSAGRTLVTVRPEDRYDEATLIITRNHGYDMNRRIASGEISANLAAAGEIKVGELEASAPVVRTHMPHLHLRTPPPAGQNQTGGMTAGAPMGTYAAEAEEPHH